MKTLTIKLDYREGTEKFVAVKNSSGYWDIVNFDKEWGTGIDDIANSTSKVKATAIAEYLTSWLPN